MAKANTTNQQRIFDIVRDSQPGDVWIFEDDEETFEANPESRDFPNAVAESVNEVFGGRTPPMRLEVGFSPTARGDVNPTWRTVLNDIRRFETIWFHTETLIVRVMRRTDIMVLEGEPQPTDNVDWVQMLRRRADRVFICTPPHKALTETLLEAGANRMVTAEELARSEVLRDVLYNTLLLPLDIVNYVVALHA
jgi:hypothetical protein